MKRRIAVFILAAALLLGLSGCAAKKPLAPSLFVERCEAAQAGRSPLTDDGIWELCPDKAVGTVVSVRRVSREYFPVLINLNRPADAYRAVPVEQWAADKWLLTVKLDEVLDGRTFAYDSYDGYATVEIPLEYAELEYWDEKAPRYTGRKFAAASPDDPVPQVGDRLTLLYKGLPQNECFVYLGEKLLSAASFLPGVRDGSYGYADVCRRNVVEPMREGATCLETAFVEPMRELGKLSPEKAGARIAFAVRGTVKTAELLQGPIYADLMQWPDLDDPLETWDAEAWRLTVTVDEALKQDGEPLEAGDELLLCVPKTLTNAESGKSLTFDGAVPAEGAEVTVWWNEGGTNNAAIDFIARTADGSLDVLYGFVERDPPGPDGPMRID